MISYKTKTEADTIQIATRLAKQIKKGDVIALYGSLGMGKTVFCRGFIQSFLPETEVPSPTFTLLQTYDTEKFPIYHFDMYRLKSPTEAYEIGIEDAFAEGVSLIEWPEKIGRLLPKKHISVILESEGECRKITIEGIS